MESGEPRAEVQQAEIHPELPSAKGTLLVVASPWAKVVAIQDEKQEEVPFDQPAYTPLRLELPEGPYTVSLEYADWPVCTRTIQVESRALASASCSFGEASPMDLLEGIGS